MNKIKILSGLTVLIFLTTSVWFNLNETKQSDLNEISGIDGYAQLMNYYRADPNTGILDQSKIDEVHQQVQRMDSRRLAKDLTWEFVGPDNVGGRTRAFIIDRDDNNLMLVGSVSGGVFRSTTRGSSWVPVMDNLADLNVTCLTQTDKGTMFAATGESFFTNLNGFKTGSNAFTGGNMYISEDRGLTWKKLATKPAGSYFSSMEFCESTKKLYAGGSAGCMVSSDDGKTWRRAKTGNTIEIKTASNGHVWINQGGSIYLAKDGETFSIQSVGQSASNRVSIAVSPQDPNYVYFMASKSAGNALQGVYRTTDGGDTYENIIQGGSPYFDPLSQAGTSQGQGKYGNVICVDPLNKNKIIMGGVQLGEWTPDGGPKIFSTSVQRPGRSTYVHADKHLMKWDMSTSPATMIIGTDGGLFFSQDQISWTEKNKNYSTFQSYAVSANRLGHTLSGSQDNGSQLMNGGGNSQGTAISKSGIEIQGGDGFSCELSSVNTNVMFSTSQQGVMRRSGNGGKTTAEIWDDRIGSSTKVISADQRPINFFTQMYLWENQTTSKNRLYYVYGNSGSTSTAHDIWAAIDAVNQDQPMWFRVASLPLQSVSEMESTPDGNTLFTSIGNAVYRTTNLDSVNYDDSTYKEKNVSSQYIIPKAQIPSEITTKRIYNGSMRVLSVNLDPNDPNHMIITLGGYTGSGGRVLETKNALAATPTFTNIHGNLPNLPVYDAVVSFTDSKYIVIGSDYGTFATENSGTTWEHQITNFASVPVFELKQYKFDNVGQGVIYAGTHGRGVWKSQSLFVSNPTVKKVKAASLKIYPNPVIDYAISEFSVLKSEKATVRIYNLSGQLMSSETVQANSGGNSHKSNTHGLKEGFYIMVIQGDNFKTSSKFMKVK